MKSKIGLYEVFYKQGNHLTKISRILSKDEETAMKEVRWIFRERLAQMRNIELCAREIPIEKSVLKAKNPA